jgi:phospholipid/cholesterol/gamma-HCH transport system ATP-binding protein
VRLALFAPGGAAIAAPPGAKSARRLYTVDWMQTLEFKNLTQFRGQNPEESKLFQEASGFWEGPSVQVLMGPSGVGKSSFIKTLGGVWRIPQGQVLYKGRPLWNSQKTHLDPSLLKTIGFSFQNNALFSSMRVLENLTFPYSQRFPQSSRKDREQLAHEWLKKVGLEANAFMFPHELSGGMQKRLGIARTLILQPEFIFLDDPTAGLDPITSKVMAELVMNLLKDSHALVVIVTNDPDRAKEWGPHIHVLTTEGIFSPGHNRYSKIVGEYL